MHARREYRDVGIGKYNPKPCIRTPTLAPTPESSTRIAATIIDAIADTGVVTATTTGHGAAGTAAAATTAANTTNNY